MSSVLAPLSVISTNIDDLNNCNVKKYTFQKALAHKTCDVYRLIANLSEIKSNAQDQLAFSE